MVATERKPRAAKDPRTEEREARELARRLERATRASVAQREREARSRVAAVIREELGKPRAKGCRCGITTRTTRAQLWALGAGCTAGRWVCPVLDTIRRRLDR